MTLKHLWEVDHPFYCNEGNYYADGCGSECASWADFIASMGDADLDMNLLFRFDWKESEDVPHAGDVPGAQQIAPEILACRFWRRNRALCL